MAGYSRTLRFMDELKLLAGLSRKSISASDKKTGSALPVLRRFPIGGEGRMTCICCRDWVLVKELEVENPVTIL